MRCLQQHPQSIETSVFPRVNFTRDCCHDRSSSRDVGCSQPESVRNHSARTAKRPRRAGSLRQPISLPLVLSRFPTFVAGSPIDPQLVEIPHCVLGSGIETHFCGFRPPSDQEDEYNAGGGPGFVGHMGTFAISTA